VRASIGPALADRYSIERELGSGSMALVFLAHDLKHDRSVALKVLRPELSHAIGADRFQREIEVVAGLTHPHIMPLHDSGQAGELLYYVMPYIEAGTLRRRLERDGQIAISDATRIAREVGDALGFAHRHGVIHRDVKPGNILLTESHALLADFGIAHLAETDGQTLTRTGLALGTPTYFSPEQATAEHDIDGRSDVYSLGCVLYECVTGEPPFESKNVRTLITRHIVEKPPHMRDLRSEVSDGLEVVVQTALQKDPSDRFQTAEEMVGSIDLVSGGFEMMAARALRKLIVGPKHKWLRGWRLAVGLSAVAVLLAAAGLVVQKILRHPVFAGVYPTYAILPFQGDELSEEEKRRAIEGARHLYYHLSGWGSIEVVGGAALEGPTNYVVRAGIGVPTMSLTAGLALLETLNASHLVYVDVNMWADSIALLVTIHESGSQREDDRLVRSEGPISEMKLIAAGIALQILEINGQPAELADLMARSSNHFALQELDKGRAALEDWKLARAEEHFRTAIQADTDFALAHYYLATTMYWRTVQDPERILTYGPVIASHAMQADLLGVERRLRPGERRAVDAFNSFWEGDYETARARYDTILNRRPTDLEVLVLAGAVESNDPWVADLGDGRYVPRRDLNRARALYDSAVGLSPEVQLAWGTLFDIDRELARATLLGECPLFHPAEGEIFPPYEIPEAAYQLPYCPYVEESLIRWQADDLLPAQRETTLGGIAELRARTNETLEWWITVERDQPRPHEELADWMLWERSIPGCSADGLWADSLLNEAREHIETALALRGDTTPEDRVRFASILLAVGEREAALRQADRALGELGNWRAEGAAAPRLEASNIYLAGGRGTDAAEVLQRTWDASTFAVPDPDNEGAPMAGGSVWGVIWGLGALGIAGGDDNEISVRFDQLDRTWNAEDYSERQRASLRYHSTRLVSPALVRFPDRWDAWFAGWDAIDVEPHPVWVGIRRAATDPEAARSELDAAVAALASADRPVRAYDYFGPLVLAGMLGEDSVASVLRAQAAVCPLNVNRVDFGWGMRR
jgi:tetratricopeptide (TPR) repeat protein